MEAKKQLTLKFYQNLGKLFYAIAAVDDKVNNAEISKLKELITEEWLAIDNLEDLSVADAANQIEIVFDWLSNDHKFNVKACYDDFVNFKIDNNHLFTNKIKKLILKTANAIAESFSGKNKSELILLAKLNIELNKE